MNNTQQYSQCPYNSKHTMPKDRYLTHVSKCPQKKDVGHLFQTCRFNLEHIIAKNLIDSHENSKCADRDKLKILQVDQQLIDEAVERQIKDQRKQPKPIKIVHGMFQQIDDQTLQKKKRVRRKDFEIQEVEEEKQQGGRDFTSWDTCDKQKKPVTKQWEDNDLWGHIPTNASLEESKSKHQLTDEHTQQYQEDVQQDEDDDDESVIDGQNIFTN